MHALPLRSLAVALFVFGFARAAEINLGDKRDDVVAKLPKPSAVAKRGDREIFLYPNGARIEFADGKVDDIRGQLPAALATPAAPAPAAAAVAAAPVAPAATRPAPPAVSNVERPPAAAKVQKQKSAAPAAASAAAAATPPKTRDEALRRAGVKFTAGPATVPVGKVAELKLPAGFAYVGPDSLDRFYELTHNMRGGDEVGVLLSPADWILFFDYDDTGYIKDDDKNQLDAEKLMKSMTANQDRNNADRKKRGWDEMKLKGWASPPHYDTTTNNLKWAINLTSSRDGFKEVGINESIRLLGRGGVMKVTLVTDAAGFKAAEAEAERLLANDFAYVTGQKYAEFKAGDKVAAYGLSALVLGGAGVMAAKSGLLAKTWKLIIAALVAIAAVAKKLWNRISGANPPSA